MRYIKLKILICVLFLPLLCNAQQEPQIGILNNRQYFVPPPIVLVHGLASDESSWNDVYNNLIQNWFLNDGVNFKYNYNSSFTKTLTTASNVSYVLYPFAPLFDYSDNNNGDINVNGKSFHDFLTSKVLNSNNGAFSPNFNLLDENTGLPSVSSPNQVFIFGHSMGGLLTRSALSDTALANKVWGVGTVGTPNFGSYLGSGAIVINQISGPVSQEDFALSNEIESETDPIQIQYLKT